MMAEKLLTPEIVERREDLRQEQERVMEDTSSRGVLRSGETVTRLRRLYLSELRVRSELFWNVHRRVLSETGVDLDEDLRDRLLARLEEFMSQTAEELRYTLEFLEDRVGGLGSVSFEGIREEAQETIEAEIELFFLSAARDREVTEGRVHIHGPNFGIVQVGENPRAAVQIIEENREVFERALIETEKVVDQSEQLSGEAREYIKAVIKDVHSELESTDPNPLRIGSWLSGIAQSIQTVAAARGAYSAIRAALALLG